MIRPYSCSARASWLRFGCAWRRCTSRLAVTCPCLIEAAIRNSSSPVLGDQLGVDRVLQQPTSGRIAAHSGQVIEPPVRKPGEVRAEVQRQRIEQAKDQVSSYVDSLLLGASEMAGRRAGVPRRGDDRCEA
jgi:hypothetical protein